jgi:hypothetical protein
MVVALIIASAVAVGLAVLYFLANAKAGRLTTERDGLAGDLETTRQELADVKTTLAATSGELETAQARNQELAAEVSTLGNRLSDTTTDLETVNESLRRRTELADAQAMQIDAVSAERDELQGRLQEAEERIVTLAARPGVVVGSGDGDDPASDTLWDLEVARTERLWRNSVAINPVDDTSPFDDSDDPVRTAIEIEAAALREDVGALITVDWQAEPIESASRRVLVTRVTQELLAQAARAPGATRLIAAETDQGELLLTFEADDDSGEVINLIPPRVPGGVLEASDDAGLSLTVKA